MNSARAPCWPVCAVTLLCMASASAEIHFDQLSACGDVHLVLRQLRSGFVPPKQDCGRTRTPIERALLQRLGPQPAVRICLLRRAPTDTLGRFDCIRTDYGDSSSLLCIADADGDDIADYRNHYNDRYEVRSKAYQRAAGSCPDSNGDVAETAITMTPHLLRYVSRMEFSVLQRWDLPEPSNGYAIHGYASVDSKIELAPEKIEFVEFSYARKPPVVPQGREFTTVGGWSIGLDDGGLPEMRKAARKQGVPFLMEIIDIEIRHKLPAPHTPQQKDELLAAWRDGFRKQLLAERYRIYTDEQLKRESGQSYDDIKAMVGRMQPYANRAGIAESMRMSLEFLINQHAPGCVKREGAMAAAIFATPPMAGVASEYGGLQVVLFGLGACNAGDVSARRNLADLKQQLLDQFNRTMETQQ